MHGLKDPSLPALYNQRQAYAVSTGYAHLLNSVENLLAAIFMTLSHRLPRGGRLSDLPSPCCYLDLPLKPPVTWPLLLWLNTKDFEVLGGCGLGALGSCTGD